MEHPPPAHPIFLTGIDGVTASMIANAFVLFFKSNRAFAEAKYTSDAQAWNFGRIIRNALAHKGVINITNVNAPAVSWRGLSYSRAQNGRRILH